MRERFLATEYAERPVDAPKEAVAELILTVWDDIAAIEEEFEHMRTPVVIGGRHTIERREVIVYEGQTW